MSSVTRIECGAGLGENKKLEITQTTIEICLLDVSTVSSKHILDALKNVKYYIS